MADEPTKPSETPTERNKRLVMEGVDRFNRGDWTAPDAYSEDFVLHAAHTKEPFEGYAGFKEVHDMVKTAFPDYKMTIHELIAEGDKVTAILSWTGTHTGPLDTLPPTGREIEMHEVLVYRFDSEGHCAEMWSHQDQGSLMQQLGLAPEGPPPKAVMMLLKLAQKFGGGPGAKDKAKEPAVPVAEYSITINRREGQVFGFVSDPGNDPQWRSGVAAVEKLSGDGPGAEYRHVIKGPVGRKTEIGYRVTAFEPYTVFEFQATEGDVRPRGRYELEKLGRTGATRVTFRLEVDDEGIGRLERARVSRTMAGEVKSLENLRKVLEA